MLARMFKSPVAEAVSWPVEGFVVLTGWPLAVFHRLNVYVPASNCTVEPGLALASMMQSRAFWRLAGDVAEIVVRKRRRRQRHCGQQAAVFQRLDAQPDMPQAAPTAARDSSARRFSGRRGERVTKVHEKAPLRSAAVACLAPRRQPLSLLESVEKVHPGAMPPEGRMKAAG